MGPGGSEQRVYSPARDLGREIHEVLGLSVFAITWMRLAWRAFAAPPPLASGPLWMRRASRLVQGVLYLLLIVTPMAAVLGAWLEGHALTLGVLGNVPPMIGEAHALGERIAASHGTLGDAVIWLAGVHAAAALFHHFVLRDEVLLSMIPARLRSRLRAG